MRHRNVSKYGPSSKDEDEEQVCCLHAAGQTHSSVVNTSLASLLLRLFRVAPLACRITRRGRSRCCALELYYTHASITLAPLGQEWNSC
ncbi:hypothetical protein E2C01_056621 [Portunus trituberculatus]|uniref:Uncharacterized protein n=1 Tax=Portunus trituberculatus TaxID=210409 RepID=A0A5B7GYQ7_PORTR|nr:hypothetical protein [Portunus trituberculatus]